MVSDLDHFCIVVSLTQHIAVHWFLLIILLAFCYYVIITIIIMPVSHHKGGETVFKKLVSLHGQILFRTMHDFQAQFQANAVELRQFCTITYT